MSGMTRADLIYSENVYLIIQIQPSDGSNIHSQTWPSLSWLCSRVYKINFSQCNDILDIINLFSTFYWLICVFTWMVSNWFERERRMFCWALISLQCHLMGDLSSYLFIHPRNHENGAATCSPSGETLDLPREPLKFPTDKNEIHKFIYCLIF